MLETSHWGWRVSNVCGDRTAICHLLVIPALALWLQNFTTVTFVHGLVECRVEMECTFEILNLRKFPLGVGTNNNVCTQIVV